MLFKALFSAVIFVLLLSVATRFYKQRVKTATPKPRNQIETVLSTPTPTSSPLKTIAWVPYWDQKTAFESFSKNVKLFDFVSVFWYRIDKDGNLKTYKQTVEDQSIIDFAHQNNVKILAVVANLLDYEEGGDWDWQRVDRVISTADARSKHIAVLLQFVQEKNLDGIDIDYEALKAPQGENFSLFIEELAQKLRQKGKLLGVAIHPKTSEDNPEEDNGSHAQDLERISKVADHMYFMNYTQNSIFSEPGPAGSVDWIDQVLAYALNDVKVPPEKVFFGIGLFGLEWHKLPNGSFYGDSDDLTFREIQLIIKNNNANVRWDDKLKSSHFEYQKEGENHIVWFENVDSVSERIKLAKELKVGGIAFWRLGGEDPKIWEIVKEQ